MAIKVLPSHFSGAGKVFGREPDHLGAIIRGLAVDAARLKSSQLNTTALTDNSGGTAAAGLAANAAPDAAAGAATTSAPKAGFDAELVKIANNLADLALRTNLLLTQTGLPLLTDSTGGTADTTLEALLIETTAVDGSTGAAALEEASARARMATVNNALSSLVAKTNALAAALGVTALTDALGGTVSGTLAVLAATAAGVGGTEPVTMLDTAVETWLTVNRHNIATVAAHLDSMVGTDVLDLPNVVVAG